jgi:hypothetical protein
MTGPFSPAILEAIKGNELEHIVKVTADPTGGAPFEVYAEGLSITYAEDWSPHIQADITAAVPTTEQLNLLDPRINCRIQIDCGYRYPNGLEEVPMLADLGLRSRPVSRPDNRLTLSAASDEARAQDRRRVEDYGPFTTFDGINELVQFFADYAVYPATAEVLTEYPADGGYWGIYGITASIGTPMWDVIADAAARCNVWVHCTSDRKWRIRPKVTTSGTPQHVLTVGKDGTIETSDSKLDRVEWFNQSILEYTWKDAAGDEHTVYGRARVTSGPYAVDTVGYKTDHLVINRAATQSQADAAAASRVSNLVTRGRSLSLEAHAAYWLRPAMTITVQLQTGPAENHLIKSITFDPGAGRMSIETRQPLDVTITTGE